MLRPLNIVLAGVGGQGTLVAGKILGEVAIRAGLDVKVSEVHGMAQRGGSVVTYVRFAPVVFSPVVEPGCAHAILAFEELEALRWAHLLAVQGTLLINEKRIIPMSVAIKQAVYPENISGYLREQAGNKAFIRKIPASEWAMKAGHERVLNTVMLGALSAFFDLPTPLFDEAIDAVFPQKLRAINHEAFRLGSAIMSMS